MLRKLSLSCVLTFCLVSAGCSSTRYVQPVATPKAEKPQPPAWLMAPAPDLQTPLNGIISPSESA